MDIRPLEAKALLQIFFVANQHIDMISNGSKHLVCAVHPADRLPKLLPIIQVEGADDPLPLSFLQRLNQQLGRRLRQRGKNTAAMEPAHPLAEDLLPVEVARL